MNIFEKRTGMVVVLLLVLVVSLVQTSRADTAIATAKEKLPAFLSEVIGLDLTEYNKTNEGYGVSYPSTFGGLVKEENIIFTLESNDSKIAVAGVFDNGFPSWIHFYPIHGSMIYAQQPSTDALDESRNILQRYQTFAENYGIDTAHIVSALSMLNDITNSPSASANSGNINNISDFTPVNATSGNMKLTISRTGIGWCYTANGVDMSNKGMGMDFGHNTFVFSDTWDFYSIGSFSVISKDEAVSIAWAAALNYNLTVTGLKPDWTNMTSDVGLLMVPGQIHNNSLNSAVNFVNMGNATRNPLALYPLWQMIFYFSKPIGGTVGMQVGVWGDTKEIAYCSSYGFLGGDTSQTPVATPSPSPSPTPSPTPSPSPTPTESPGLSPSPTQQSTPSPQPQPTAFPTELLYATVGTATVLIAVGAAVMLRRKSRSSANFR